MRITNPSANPSATAVPFALDRPLPDALTGRAQGWLMRYKRWPVFSPAWQRGRLVAWGFWVGVLLLVLLGSVLQARADDRPWPAMVQLLLELLLPLLIGPWLAGQVRRRGWAPAHEFAGLCAAVAVTVALLLGFHLQGAEAVKQWVAGQLGTLDAEGRRPPVALSIGISVGRMDGRGESSRARNNAVAPPAAPAEAPSAAKEAKAPATAAAAPAAPAPAATYPPQRLLDEPGVWALNVAVRGLSAFLLGGGIALWGWRREQRGLLALAQEQALAQAQAQRREAELRLSVLAAQVEPHFLFNTLAGVRSAIATDPLRASDMIDRLAAYLRASIPRLRHDGAADSTLGQQLDQVRAYLGLMAARMPRLQCQVQVPAGLLPAHFPPLMLISLAENAVKHGVEPKVGAAQVWLTAGVAEDGRLAVTVADDGVGFSGATAGSGLGLANIRERLAQLYGERAGLVLRARPEGGVAATLSLPLELPGTTPETTPEAAPGDKPNASTGLAPLPGG